MKVKNIPISNQKYKFSCYTCFYVENVQNGRITNFLLSSEGKKKIEETTQYSDVRFIYFPLLFENIDKEFTAFLGLNQPESDLDNKRTLQKIFGNDFFNKIEGNAIMMIRYRENYGDEAVLISCSNPEGLLAALNAFKEEADRNAVRFNLDDMDEEEENLEKLEECGITINLSEETSKDYTHDKELVETAKRIANEIHRLGIPMDLLRSLLEERQQLYPIRVSKEGRIFLENYPTSGTCREVKMTVMGRALYMLYMRHVEGIAYPYLQDYEEELYEIYSRITNSKDSNTILERVKAFVDPLTDNKMIEASRIRRSFLTLMDNMLASHYYITGARGESRKIQLDRSLVSWE